MPYIEESRRRELEEGWVAPRNVGELNYVITKLAIEFLGTNPHYEDFNGVIGVLESAKLELYRRAVAPYEDYKRDENGDVY